MNRPIRGQAINVTHNNSRRQQYLNDTRRLAEEPPGHATSVVACLLDVVPHALFPEVPALQRARKKKEERANTQNCRKPH